ncbi:hypothetical protein IQ63_17055 [Streptomyces acidiscabies]|uniref:Uncharacterized protein n=1 Tax=Streptomyces acidiscabies TaxID=42234 RepID=A0A0L0K921_9ACTN|nr:hypothetical protein [Streptomyces acidiscabies]KND34159.1 hypothetical protein IQ63_17055 [Streptomyces acidiscabies]
MTDALLRIRELNLYRQYLDFEALLDGEGPAGINPTAARDEQLADIRAIYPPDKEALGALAIEIGRLG